MPDESLLLELVGFGVGPLRHSHGLRLRRLLPQNAGLARGIHANDRGRLDADVEGHGHGNQGYRNAQACQHHGPVGVSA